MNLLQLANTEGGRILLWKLGARPEYPIVKITPNSLIEHVENKTYRATFFSRKPIADVFYPIIEQIKIANEYKHIDDTYRAFLHYSGLQRNKRYPGIYLSTLGPIYPSAGSAYPVDGFVQRAGVDQTFSNIRTGAGTAANTTDASNAIPLLNASTTASQFSELDRGIFCFDTSPLTSIASISAAVYSQYGYSTLGNGIGSPAIHVAGATPAAYSQLTASDYGQCQTTSFANIAYASYSVSGYNDFTFNASGLAAINKIGYTGLSTQLSWDINNNFDGSWSSGALSYFRTTFADTGSNQPKLVVTYTLSSAGGIFFIT